MEVVNTCNLKDPGAQSPGSGLFLSQPGKLVPGQVVAYG